MTNLRSFTLILSFSAAALGGCTTLGPMPMTTGMVNTPAARPDVEAQAGIVPGYYLSQATSESAEGRPLGQAAGMLEPGRLIGAPGLGVGARYIGSDGSDGYFEPMVRYRGALDDDRRFTGVGVLYGTHASGGSADAANYSATRGGLELGADARLTPKSPWVELHAFASASVTGLDAKGRYCLDSKGFGSDCQEARTIGEAVVPADIPVAAKARGLYPAGTAGLAVDFGKRLESVFHGGRLAIMGSAGTQPHLEAGQQRSARFFASAGATLTVGFGAL